MPEGDRGGETQRNVLGGALATCSERPLTGFFRTGCCHTGAQDRGLHTVCIECSEDFLEYSRSVGNDLSTPHPEFEFPGLKAGDRWCLCAARWKQALLEGRAPRVVLASTNQVTLHVVTLEELMPYAIDPP